jgi:hypothetical protein
LGNSLDRTSLGRSHFFQMANVVNNRTLLVEEFTSGDNIFGAT